MENQKIAPDFSQDVPWAVLKAELYSVRVCMLSRAAQAQLGTKEFW